jgi:hypothetical protein
MSTKKKKKKVNTVFKPRVYLGTREVGALAYLRAFKEFENISVSDIFRNCLLIVAMDAKLKQEANNEKVNVADTPDDAGVQPGERVGKEDNSGPSEDPEGPTGEAE